MRVVLARTGLVLSPAAAACWAGCGRCSPSGWAHGSAAAGSTCRGSASRTRSARLLFAINHDDLSGPVNFTGPAPVTNSEFTAALGRALNRPTPLAGSGIRAAHPARRVRRRGPARRAAGHPGRPGAGGFRVPPQHHRRGAGLRHRIRPGVVRIGAAVHPVQLRPDRGAAAGHRRLPGRLAAAARSGRRPGGRRSRHPAAARTSVGLHRGQAHDARGTSGATARPSSTPTGAARSPGTGPASWWATR